MSRSGQLSCIFAVKGATTFPPSSTASQPSALASSLADKAAIAHQPSPRSSAARAASWPSGRNRRFAVSSAEAGVDQRIGIEREAHGRFVRSVEARHPDRRRPGPISPMKPSAKTEKPNQL